MDKSEVVAFDREKRAYKDAYVENFRQVRYFPALATIGAGRATAASIVLVQETPAQQDAPASDSPGSERQRRKFDDVPSRLLPPDSLEEIFESAPPLTSFRSTVMCKHALARRERERQLRLAGAATASQGDNQARDGAAFQTAASRYGAPTQPAFRPASNVEAKQAIQRQVSYDAQEFRDKPRAVRSTSPRTDAPLWASTNAASARADIRNKVYFHVPLEGAIKADRKYTQQFIRLNVEAHRARRRAGARNA